MVKSFTNVMILVSLILLLGGPSSAQNQTGPVQTVDAVPSGACNTKIVLKVGGEAAAADQGKTYCCTASTWSQCWEVDVSAELAAALADETGSSADSFVVFSDSPTFVGWDDGETVFEWDDGGGHPHEIKMRMDHDCFGGLCPTGGDHYVVLVWEPEYDGDTLLDVSGFAMGDFRGVNAAGGAAILQIRDPTDLYPDLALTGTNVLTDVVTFNRDPNDDLQIRVKGGDIGLLDDNLTTTGTITGEQITSTDDATVTGKLTSGDVTTGGLTSTGNTDIYNFQGNLAKDNSGNFLEWFVGNSRSVLTNYGRWPTAELTCNTGDFALSGDDCTDLFNSTGHFTSDVVDAVGCPVPGPGCAPQLEELVIVVGGNDNGPIHPSDINHTIGKWFWQARFHGSEFYIPDNMKVELQYDNDLVGESACCDSGGTACTWQTAQDVSGYQANGDIESLFQYTLTSDLPNYPAGAVSVCGIRWTWGDWRCTNGGSCNLDKVRLSDMTFGYFMNETHGEYPLTYDPDNRNFMLDAIEWLDDSGTLYGVEFNTTADQFELDAGVVVKNKTNAVENWTIEALNSIGYGNLVIQDTTDSPGGGYVCIGDWDGTANKDCADAGFLGQLNLLSGLGYAELVLADTNMTGRVTFNASSTGDLTITPIGGDLNIPNATLNITGTGSIDLTSNALVDGILDSGVATTTHATDANFLQLLRHATDCTAITDGKDGELCIEEDDDALYSCQETGDGTCNTPGEWISVGGGGFSPTDLATDYGTETITDTWTIQSLFNFDSGTEGTLRLPTSTSLPGTCSIGDTYYDTDGDTDGELYVCRAANTWKAVDDDGGAGGFVSWDVTDTDASPILTVDSTEQVQFIGAGTVTVSAAADGANHDVTITGSETNDLETDGANGIADEEIVWGTGTGTAAYGKISTLPEELAPAAGDWLLAEDDTGALNKIDVGDLPGSGTVGGSGNVQYSNGVGGHDSEAAFNYTPGTNTLAADVYTFPDDSVGKLGVISYSVATDTYMYGSAADAIYPTAFGSRGVSYLEANYVQDKVIIKKPFVTDVGIGGSFSDSVKVDSPGILSASHLSTASAAGTTCATGADLENQINRFTTVGTGTANYARMESCVTIEAGSLFTVINDDSSGNDTLNLCPATGGDIGAGINTAIEVPYGMVAICTCHNTDTFACALDYWEGSGLSDAEINDLSVAVTWANVPDANVDGGNERDEVLVAAAGGTDLTCAAGVCNVDSPVTSATTATTATTANNLASAALDATAEIDGTLCGTNEILEDQGASWVCIATPSGGGHGDGLNCAVGEIPLGVDANGAVQGCYEPAEADITDLSHFTTGDEINNLSVAVTWANVPDANINGGNERDEVLVAAAGGTDLTCAAGVCNVDSPVTSATTATTATTANNLAAGALDATTEIDGTMCGTNEILEDQGASWACITTPAGGSETNTLTTVLTGIVDDQFVVGGAGVATYDTVPDCDAAGAALTYDTTANNVACATDLATDTELAAQDECSEITGCVVSAITATGVTYENLSTNSDIGFGASQVPQGSLTAPLASPALTGTPTAPTASSGDSDTSIATTDFVDRRTQHQCKTVESLVAADDNIIMDVFRQAVTITAVACESSAAATVVLEDYGGTAIETIVCNTDGSLTWDISMSGTATLIAGEVMRMDTTSESTPTWTMICWEWTND